MLSPMDLTVGSEAGVGVAAPEAEHGMPQPPVTPPVVGGRKKGTSCARCRRQKIRCDDNVPSCGNCIRAGQVCIRTHSSNNPDVISHINSTEARLRFLEDTLRRVAPEELAKAPMANKPGLDRIGSYAGQTPPAEQAKGLNEPSGNYDGSGINRRSQNGYTNNHRRHPSSTSDNGTIGSPTASSQIGPNEPLAHEVGLLSLANSRESKYLGPSSGVPFARRIFSAIPQSQGLATTWVSSPASGAVGSRSRGGVPQAQPFPLNWTSDVDLQHFVDAYFETYHPLHPFIDGEAISERLEIMYNTNNNVSPSPSPTPTPTMKSDPRQGGVEMPQLGEIESSISPMYSVQIFLIVALGARALETRLSADFSSERYLATAQARIESLGLPLHDTTEGLQVMLLLTLSSFYFENGPNAWFLNTNVIASCLDLGFQRRWTADHHHHHHHSSAQRAAAMSTSMSTSTSREEQRQVLHRKNVRSAIFWSTYSIERNLSVVLGRPLTLRDEAIDVEFPGEGAVLSAYSHNRGSSPPTNLGNTHAAGDADADTDGNYKRPRLDLPQDEHEHDRQYTAAQYSFRLDQIVAEIKLMLHRVVNLPSRFPWPGTTPETDLTQWQRDTRARCDAVLDEILSHYTTATRGTAHAHAHGNAHAHAHRHHHHHHQNSTTKTDITIRSTLELKYHQTQLLLHRPSPALPHPSLEAWRICYQSATRTVAIYADLHRLRKLGSSWVAAHAVFVSGITFVYCVRAQPAMRGRGREGFVRDAAACAAVLRFLGRSWSVAADAVGIFERLAEWTAASAWGGGGEEEEDGGMGIGGEAGGRGTATTAPASAPAPLRRFQGYDATQQAVAESRSNGDDGGNIDAANIANTDYADQYAAAENRNGNGTRGGFDFEPMSFYTELGDTSAWFDLDWILSLNTGPSGEVISYPVP